MTTISDVFATGLEQIRKSWGWFLVAGILNSPRIMGSTLECNV